jgi:hypothetical protein
MYIWLYGYTIYFLRLLLLCPRIYLLDIVDSSIGLCDWFQLLECW